MAKIEAVAEKTAVEGAGIRHKKGTTGWKAKQYLKKYKQMDAEMGKCFLIGIALERNVSTDIYNALRDDKIPIANFCKEEQELITAYRTIKSTAVRTAISATIDQKKHDMDAILKAVKEQAEIVATVNYVIEKNSK